ncbi:MAG TPA: CBS domain-containing protein [Kofleriaceae bacterium]|nr:CBS domain-containing protein [Kofleriaceae bacterium]
MSCGMEALARARVDELALRPHATVGIDAAMWKVVEQMKAKGRGAVLIEEDGALVGIFTERDLLNRVDHGDPLWSHLQVRDVMTPHPMVIHGDDSLSEALRRMTGGHRRHLPVVDERGRVTGMVSIRDVLTFVAERFPEDLVNLPPHPDHET